MHSVRLVIGYGNPLRGDDGLGWIVAQRLKEAVREDHALADVVVLVEHQLTPELAEQIGRARRVVFVDAREGDRPGRVACHAVAPSEADTVAFSHDVNPPALLALARLLYGRSPGAVAVSVDGGDFGYGTALSDAVRAAVPKTVQQVLAILDGDGLAACAPMAAGSVRRSMGG